ncbi:hypothetical protein CQ065_16360 [Pseudomonas sp. MYb187]|jgi:hypothetical protein|nr:hypothetical protein CQ065_16360 [Pseudomonas sp. MYb187]
MQASNEEQKQNLIQLALTAEDFHVAGFSKKYAAYLDGQAGGGVYNGGLLLIVGFIIGAVGVATLIFGPPSITTGCQAHLASVHPDVPRSHHNGRGHLYRIGEQSARQ